MSTDTALSNLTNRIEKATLQNEYALAVFLDIKWAFDTLTAKGIWQAFRKRQIPDYITCWYMDYRSVSARMDKYSLTRKLQRGTPQGGILSPLIWNLLET